MRCVGTKVKFFWGKEYSLNMVPCITSASTFSYTTFAYMVGTFKSFTFYD